MLKIILISLLLFLTGCSTSVPLVAKFPDAPGILMEPCEQLQPVNNDAKLSDVTKTVIINYTTYHDCAMRHSSWIEWYKNQKQIFEKVSK